jgi:hypothetical protein
MPSPFPGGTLRMPPLLRALVLGLLAAGGVVGCSAPAPTAPPPPQAPEILAFSASASRVKPGEAVTLTWQTQHASAVELHDLALGLVSGVSGEQGTVEVTVNQSALFVLSARNSRGLRETAAVAVAVLEGSREALFTASPSSVSAGEGAVLAWIADGAREISLRVKGGSAVDVGDQKTAGFVKVTPTTRTTWELTVDGQVREATVDVRPVVVLVAANPTAVTAGEEVTVQWVTLGAQRVTLEAVGRGTVHQVTAPGEVAEGSFTDTVPAWVGPADVVSYVVHAEAADGVTTRATLQLYVAGNPEVLTFTGPDWATEGMSFPLSWTTQGADVVEITADGVPFYRSGGAATAEQGSIMVPTPAQPTSYRLAASSARGGQDLSDAVLVTPVGVPR